MCIVCGHKLDVIYVFENLLLFKYHLNMFIHEVASNKVADFILRNRNKKAIQANCYYNVRDTTLIKNVSRLNTRTELIKWLIPTLLFSQLCLTHVSSIFYYSFKSFKAIFLILFLPFLILNPD